MKLRPKIPTFTAENMAEIRRLNSEPIPCNDGKFAAVMMAVGIVATLLLALAIYKITH